MSSAPAELFVGAYEAGLYPLSGNGEDWTLGQADSNAPVNASFAACRGELHYCVDETGNGHIGVWRHGGVGWRQEARVPSGGDLPCFVAVDPDGRVLAAANYGNGSIGVYWLDEAGLPDGLPQLFQNAGSGPNAKRQDGPHAHCVRFRGGLIYSTDLGTDQVLAHPFDADARALDEPFTAFQTPPGEGPRHILFHPRLPVAYVLSELGSHIFVLAVDNDGTLREVQRLLNLPEGFSGQSIAGHLALSADASRLYASNRGHDSIVSYAVDAGGRLEVMRFTPTHGKGPRHFHVLEDGRCIVVAHQDGGKVTVLALDDDGTGSGLLWAADVTQAAYIGRLR